MWWQECKHRKGSKPNYTVLKQVVDFTEDDSYLLDFSFPSHSTYNVFDTYRLKLLNLYKSTSLGTANGMLGSDSSISRYTLCICEHGWSQRNWLFDFRPSGFLLYQWLTGPPLLWMVWPHPALIQNNL